MRTRRLRRLALISVVCGILLAALGALLIYGRQLRRANLPFVVVDAYEMGEGGHLYPQTEPKLVIITRPEEASQLDNEVMRSALLRVRELDFSRFFAVAVFLGQIHETNHSVEMQRVIQQSDGVIVIEAVFHAPPPDFQRGALETSPYQVVAVDKPRNPGRDFQFVLKVAGESIIAETHFMPSGNVPYPGGTSSQALTPGQETASPATPAGTTSCR